MFLELGGLNSCGVESSIRDGARYALANRHPISLCDTQPNDTPSKLIRLNRTRSD